MSTPMSCNLRHYAPRLSDYVTLLYLAVNITSSTIGLLQLLAMYAQVSQPSVAVRRVVLSLRRTTVCTAFQHTHTHRPRLSVITGNYRR